MIRYQIVVGLSCVERWYHLSCHSAPVPNTRGSGWICFPKPPVVLLQFSFGVGAYECAWVMYGKYSTHDNTEARLLHSFHNQMHLSLPWESQNLHLLPPLSFPDQGCDRFTDLSLSHSFIGTSVRVRLLLYTREGGTCGTLMSHTDPSAHPQFNFSRPTTFLIHGYRPTGSPPTWLTDVTKLLLAKTNINVILVDWNYGAANMIYPKAARNTHTVAKNLTAFVERLKVCVCKRVPQDNRTQIMLSVTISNIIVLFFPSGKGSFPELHPHDRSQSRSSYFWVCWCQHERINRTNHR